jgi:hypothetical protein
VLEARENFFRGLIRAGQLRGSLDEGFRWGAIMLEHFLDGNGAPMSIQFTVFDDFVHDPGITRATKEYREPEVPDDEPSFIQPLLYDFVDNSIQPAAETGGTWFKVGPEALFGKDHYTPLGKEPRPYNTGFWAAFGHVTIDGLFSAEVRHNCTSAGYFVEYIADYRIGDRYAWFETKQTPFIFPFASGTVWIPHEWELSLVHATPPRAQMYDFSITWTERQYLFITDDFSHFHGLERWEWETQFHYP